MLGISAKRARNGRKILISRPQRYGGKHGRCQQVHIDPAQSTAHQAPTLDECQHFVVIRDRHRWKLADQLEDFAAPRKISARKLPDDERVSPNQPVFEELRESRVALPQVLDPDGGIDQQASAPPETACAK